MLQWSYRAECQQRWDSTEQSLGEDQDILGHRKDSNQVSVLFLSDCHGCHDVYELRDGRTHHCDLLPKICPHQWEFLLLRNISYSSVHCQKRVILHCSYFVILIFILRGLCAFTIESMSLQRHFNLVSNCAVGESWWDKDSTLVYMPQILFLFLRKPFTCLDLLKNFRWLFFWQLI